MAPSMTCPIHGLKVAVTVALLFSFLFLSSNSVQGLLYPSHGGILQKRRLVLGSRPPGCANRCLNCRPCTATLVVPSHQRKGFTGKPSSTRDDDTYYLLSWKCRCGNKIFQP